MTSQRLTAFKALCVARFREFSREPEAIFWSFVFPILLFLVMGLAFRNRPSEVLPVAVVAGSGAEAVAAPLRASAELKPVVEDEAAAFRDLRLGKVALAVIPDAEGGVEYRLDPSRDESALARHLVDETLQQAAGRRDAVATRRTEVTEPGSRYIDFLIPGIVGLNLMNGGMWGVGFSLVDMRIKRLLKRLLATPMRRADLMASHMTIRLVFMFIEVSFLLAFGRWVLGVPVAGSWPAIFLIGAVGSLSFGGMALLLASRATRLETIMGLMNAVTMPMMVCSGVFFSVERFPERLQPLIRALPLTALIDALRAVVLEGAPLAAQAGRLALLGLWGGVSFVLGLRLFRWN
jgi:ABC-type multidrug transport system permease subunit